MLKQILLAGLGGGIGSMLRFAAGQWTAKLNSFPVATFIVNILGCFLIGILAGLSSKRHVLDADMKVLLITGFCGGFTTFSAFSMENVRMYQAGNYTALIIYILSSIIIGFAAVWTGLLLTK
jgi:CrcB protein